MAGKMRASNVRRVRGSVMALRVARYFSGVSRSTVFLALASLCADTSTELLYPVLPVFLTQVLKANGSVVGLVEGTAEATQNIVQGASGWLSDKLRVRKPIAVTGYAVAALAKPLIGMATAWPGVLGARFLDRFGTGTRPAPRDALIAGSVADTHRGKAFGLEGAGDNLGAFLGPIAAVLLLSTFHVDIRAIFYIAAVPGLLAVALIALVKENSEARLHAKSRLDINLRRLPTPYWKYLFAIGVFSIGNSSNAFLILQIKDVGVSLTNTILIYAAFNLVAALTSYPAGSFSDRFGRKRILTLSFVVFFVTYLGFALTRNVILVGALFVLYGIYQGIFRSVGKALATDLVPTALRATGLGWYSATVGCSGLMASVVAGQLWDHVAHAAVFFYGAASAIAGVTAVSILVAAGDRHG
jgi:MFS family permease